MGQLNVSYASQIGTGHPGVFGEQDSPQIYTFVPSMMAQGFTLERLGADTYNFVPVTTLLGYKNNVNNVANVSNWGFGYLYKIQYYEANPAGKAMKFMVTIAYVPIWLGYDGTVHSVPRCDKPQMGDWDRSSVFGFHEDLRFLRIFSEVLRGL